MYQSLHTKIIARQHTGNWPGKTVSTAKGTYTYNNRTYTLVDLPGAYSLQRPLPRRGRLY